MKKRFIAGAVCPQCNSQDTIMVLIDGDNEKVACANCDYEQAKPEPETHSSRPEEEQVIGIFKPE
ncbi:YheV family putative zinc ribbon protein [Corallincola platygyrae]|uniref:YheV family putative zinc ribbon protein n=1 Tax=Corallincola platygyrae TaxID=1193278 RepID=A0ABW4XM19_9GAMM